MNRRALFKRLCFFAAVVALAPQIAFGVVETRQRLNLDELFEMVASLVKQRGVQVEEGFYYVA